MTLIVGNVVDVGLEGLDGTLRVWAWFRPEEVGLIAPYRLEWGIVGGQIADGVDVVPGPAVVEVDVGMDAFKTFEVVIPDQAEVTIQALFEQVFTWSPSVVSTVSQLLDDARAAAETAERAANEFGMTATATTGAAGSNATVEVTGDGPAYALGFTVPRGDKGERGERGPQGVQGVKGDKGEQGIQGIQGDTGPKGDTGDTGPKGATGERGPQGVQGPKGDTGDTGPRGLQGATGDTGPKGDTGDTGPKGDTGERGLQGERGPKGDAGEQGIQGIQGETGETGPKGDTGDTGEPGIQGPKGDKGDTGARGLQGIQGDPGEQGPQGLQGEQGEQGEQGLKGDKGDQGDQGEQGLKGDTGDRGPQGEQGLQGIQGEQGLRGLQGPKGDKGDTGDTGPKGDKGDPGSVPQEMLDAAVATLVDGAPEALDTLSELADALGGDPDFATTVSTQIGERAKTSDVNAALAGKADAEHSHAWVDLTDPPPQMTDEDAFSGSVLNPRLISPVTLKRAIHHFVVGQQHLSVSDLSKQINRASDGEAIRGLIGAADDEHDHDWSEVTGKPSTFPPATHSHSVSQVTGLQGALDDKADAEHRHSRADIDELPDITTTMGFTNDSNKLLALRPDGQTAIKTDSITEGNHAANKEYVDNAVQGASGSPGAPGVEVANDPYQPGPDPVAADGAAAVGYGADASAAAVAIGHGADAAMMAIAVGYAANAATSRSTAIGMNANAEGSHATAVGVDATATGEGAAAFGPTSNAATPNSTAIGAGTNAVGQMSVAIGNYATAQGDSSAAVGMGTNAGGDMASAIGSYAQAAGSGSAAVGISANAIGGYATAVGYATNAIGDVSAAIGPMAMAENHMQIALGTGHAQTGGQFQHEVHIPGVLVLYSPDHSMWAITVDNAGQISATPWTPTNVSPF